MSIYEALMLICFGASWPFEVVKTYKTKNVKGKSFLFLSLILLGYIFGILHKLQHYDNVIWLYVLNGLLVSIEVVFYFLYKNKD
jgi:hypothetical protein